MFTSQKALAADCSVNSGSDTSISADCDGFDLNSSQAFIVVNAWENTGIDIVQIGGTRQIVCNSTRRSKNEYKI